MATISREMHNSEYCRCAERWSPELGRSQEAQHVTRAGAVVAARCNEIRDTLAASSARMQAASTILGEVEILIARERE